MNKLNNIKKKFIDGLINKREYIDLMYEEAHSILFDYSEFIESTDISEINISDKKVVMTFRDSNIKLICNKGDKRIPPIESINLSKYEEEEMKMQIKLIESNYSIFDIGANIGWYSIYLASRFPNANIYAFEPVKQTYEHLCENIKLNKLTNIQSLNFGFSDHEGLLNFYFDQSLSGNGSLENVSESKTTKEITCLIKKLDSFGKDENIKVDFIKCDVEGAELFVFKGGYNLIEKNKPIIFSEMLRKWSAKFNYHPNDIIDLLKQLNYECFGLDGDKLKLFNSIDNDTIQTNFFFLHKEKHLEQIKKYTIK